MYYIEITSKELMKKPVRTRLCDTAKEAREEAKDLYKKMLDVWDIDELAGTTFNMKLIEK